MNNRTLTVLLSLMTVLAIASAQEKNDPTKWEEDIAKFEAQDKESFPPKNAILFIGSSSIRRWDLQTHFPNHITINRGFGGSQIEDSLFFADRIVIPYKPKTIVFYAGDNDLNKGKRNRQVFWDYQGFVKKVHDALPDTKIIFLAIKPSIKRWSNIDNIRKTNYTIREWSNNYPFLYYLDIDTPMIGDNGEPNKELLDDDDLHLSEKGYELWTELLMPLLPQPSK